MQQLLSSFGTRKITASLFTEALGKMHAPAAVADTVVDNLRAALGALGSRPDTDLARPRTRIGLMSRTGSLRLPAIDPRLASTGAGSDSAGETDWNDRCVVECPVLQSSRVGYVSWWK